MISPADNYVAYDIIFSFIDWKNTKTKTDISSRPQ